MRSVCVHKFRMGDVDDPELMAASELYKFTRSEKGMWVKEHALDPGPSYDIMPDMDNYGYLVRVMADLDDHAFLFFSLRWNDVVVS